MRAGMERMTEAMLMQKAFLSSADSGSSSSATALMGTRGSFILGQNASSAQPVDVDGCILDLEIARVS